LSQASWLGDQHAIDISAIGAAVIANDKRVIVDGGEGGMVSRDLLIGCDYAVGFISTNLNFAPQGKGMAKTPFDQ
jgi:hypothetical protein